MTGIQVRGLTVRYRDVLALDDVDVTVPTAHAVGLVGVNGSGKSTLFKAVVGLVRATAGTVEILGSTPDVARRRGLVGYVPQADEIDTDFPVSVRDVVRMGRYPHQGRSRRSRAADDDAIDSALDRVGLADLGSRRIGRLSGGQRQRVMLARALAQEAQVLLLDEPFTGVDAGSQATLTAVLQGLVAQGRSLLLSTHDLSVVPALCGSAVLLHRRVLAAGRPEDVLTTANLAATFSLPAGLR